MITDLDATFSCLALSSSHVLMTHAANSLRAAAREPRTGWDKSSIQMRCPILGWATVMTSST
eukprot:5981278-Pyramimonas_sp.AAC.1